MKNIAIIPARSGSKGLKDKNIKDLNGLPLLAYSIIAAKESKLFDEIMVSTDSQLYADIAINYGANVPFLRSNLQSGDNASSWGVVREVLENYRQNGKRFNTVCLLQPTSPLRTQDDIINAYKILEQSGGNAVTSVCEMDHSPLWSMTLPADNSLTEFRKTISEKPRQKLHKYYRFNGAVYIRKIDDTKILELPEYAFIMEKNKSVDIDTLEDFEYAEYILGKLRS